MKLKGELNTETVEAMVRECLQRRFTGMTVTKVHVAYVSQGHFELDDAPTTNDFETIDLNEGHTIVPPSGLVPIEPKDF